MCLNVFLKIKCFGLPNPSYPKVAAGPPDTFLMKIAFFHEEALPHLGIEETPILGYRIRFQIQKKLVFDTWDLLNILQI